MRSAFPALAGIVLAAAAARAARAKGAARATCAAARTLRLLDEIFAGYERGDFAVRLWDGTAWEPEGTKDARFTLVLRHPGALRAMLLPPDELSLGEAYVNDDFDIHGDIEAVFPLADHGLVETLSAADRARLGRRLLALPRGAGAREDAGARLSGRKHSRARDRQAVTYHYDRSNEFFELFLDSRMVYSCAYFAEPDLDLEIAQERKLDYICRKLRLRRGERLLDVGCGWGGLAIHAAARYGADVVGITLSERQAELARERVAAAGLDTTLGAGARSRSATSSRTASWSQSPRRWRRPRPPASSSATSRACASITWSRSATGFGGSRRGATRRAAPPARTRTASGVSTWPRRRTGSRRGA
ncbi:MAG TPA: class I SAM-dependent methyltransferase [Gaiellaceae bacterium]|nr:class I SAM-dependent methyltransferase [Gaiellaceae bacterium]